VPDKLSLNHSFVDYIPDILEDGTLYVSVEFATAVHKCCCGCGNKVVTPFSPTDWRITYNGDTVSLSPSIGNWNFNCRSHYWIKGSRVEWATDWSQENVDAGRARDRFAKMNYYASKLETSGVTANLVSKGSIGSRIKSWLVSKFRFLFPNR
jgi:hypothetical protein